MSLAAANGAVALVQLLLTKVDCVGSEDHGSILSLS